MPIVIILLVIILLGGFGGPYFGAPWDHTYGGGGALGLVLIVLLVLFLMGRF